MKKVIVIGAGLGGMSAAISLAKESDYEVTLLEKNSHLGGKLNVLHQDGFTFDLGPSILTMPHLFEQLFTMHGKKMEDYVDIVPVRPHWRNFFEDGTRIDLDANVDDMHSQEPLKEEDIHDLKRFLHYTEKLYKFTDKAYFKNQSEKKLDTIKYYNPFKIIKDSDMFSTMDEGVRRYIKNPYMIDILNFFIKYVGSSPYDAPAILNLLPYIQWKFDLWYVKGGMFNLSKGLHKLIQELNIKVVTQAEVVSVNKENQKITSVTLKTTQTLDADIVVSNMETIPFYETVTKEPEEKLAKLKQKYPPSCSGFALHLGVNKVYQELAHHNVFHAHSSKDHFDNLFHTPKLSEDPTIYLVAPMKSDPSQGPKDHEVIKILPHIPVIQDKPFTKEDYMSYQEKILIKLERMGLKDLRKHIVTDSLWTPETIQQNYYSNKGSIYGVLSDRKINMGFKIPKQSPWYKNLFFVGGSVNPGGGMPMVVLSGQQVVTQIKQKIKA